jgi:GUN4-like
MNDNPTSDDSNKEKIDEESIKPISEEEGLKFAESIFKTEGQKAENPGSDEDKEFFKYLKFRKKAKDLGLDDPSFTTIYQGGIYISDSNVENHGNFVGNDQTIDSSLNTGGFSGEVRNKSSDRNVLEASQRLQSILQPQAKVETEASSPNTGSTGKKRSQWLEEISAYRADKLHQLLESRQWKAADQETARLLLQFTDAKDRDCIKVENLDTIPCSVLQNIDRLWLKYSNHKFGFSVQSVIWQQKFREEIDGETERSLGHHFGWREGNEWKDYNKLIFDLDEACRGHLPCFFLSSLCWRYDTFLLSLLNKFVNCTP